jgi:hypothetical protein
MKTLIFDFFLRRRHNITGQELDLKIEKNFRKLATSLPICAQQNNTLKYLNQQDVRSALYIPKNVSSWSECK